MSACARDRKHVRDANGVGLAPAWYSLAQTHSSMVQFLFSMPCSRVAARFRTPRCGSIPFLHPVARWFLHFAAQRCPVFAPCGMVVSHFYTLQYGGIVFMPSGVAAACFCTLWHGGSLFSCSTTQQQPVFIPHGSAATHFCTLQHASGLFLHPTATVLPWVHALASLSYSPMASRPQPTDWGPLC